MRVERGEGRGFREVDIAISSVQDGRKRFPSFAGEEVTPPAPWRNNLTALSQEHNLYFVALQDQIHVYEPEFPSQRLPERRFWWTIPPSGSRTTGIFPRTESNWVNRLVLEYLGIEEVIATVHDNGDFIVCTLRSVRDAIDAVTYDGSSPERAATRIKYLYRTNVGASAWGIAVHQEARLLAVSANSCRVTVFAPALCHSKAWHPALAVTDRSVDKQLSLRGHLHNIPTVAFCNTGADPEGRYLVTTDIMGEVIVWDIWAKCTIKQFQMSPARHLHENYPGWSVTCIDSKSFQRVGSEIELLGYENVTGDRPRADASHSFEALRDFHTPRNDSFEPLREVGSSDSNNNMVTINGRHHRRQVFVSESEDGDEVGLDGDSTAGEDLEDDGLDQAFRTRFRDREFNDHWNDSEADDFFPSNFSGPPIDDFEDPDDWGLDSDSTAEVFSYDTVDFGPRPTADDDANMDGGFQGRRGVRNPLPVASMHPPPFAPHSRSNKSVRSLPPAPQPPELALPFSILHTGQKVATLLRVPFGGYAAKYVDPCQDRLTTQAQVLDHFDRLNLTAHIPELSLMVLASQTGRAAVISLTKMAKGQARKPKIFAQSRPARKPSGHQVEEGSESTRFGLRLDWVLPFEEQENQNQRPWAPLIGIAASPLQHGAYGSDASGTRKGVRPRRWRLMLTYKDNSVLSYELSRGGPRDESVLVF